MNLYLYDGPVMVFNKCVRNRWKGSTYAVSVEKARNNLTYRYKKENNLTVNSKVELPGTLVLVKNDVAS